MAVTVLVAGDTLGGYRVESVIGWGGMAVVYRAEQISLGRRVALKVLSPQLSHDEAFRERFRREGKHAAALDHPHVVTIFDSGDDLGRLFLAMRLVEGTTLAEEMVGGLSADETVELLTPTADALDAAHRLGLVHRDVKPQNILISHEGHPYLADFGVAKAMAATSALTAAGGFVGSINYASPEQITGNSTSAAADVYALTAVLYQCLTGQVPYLRETDAGVMHAHLHEPPPALAPLAPGGAALDLVIARGMAKHPSDRYPRASDLLAEAAAIIAALPPSARRAVPACEPKVVPPGPVPDRAPTATRADPVTGAAPTPRAARGPAKRAAPRPGAGAIPGTPGSEARVRRPVSDLTTSDQRREPDRPGLTPVLAPKLRPRKVGAIIVAALLGAALAAGAGVALSRFISAKSVSHGAGTPARAGGTAPGTGPATNRADPGKPGTATTGGGTIGATATGGGTTGTTAPGGHAGGASGPAAPGTYPLVDGLSGTVIVRTGPSSHAARAAKIDPTARVAVICTAQGESVTRGSATESTWDRIAQPSGFVSDTLVNTGSHSPVAKPCAGSRGPNPPRGPATVTGHVGKSAPNPPGGSPQTGARQGGSTPPAPTALDSTVTQFHRFTVQRPGGDWVLDTSEVAKPGYVDTRWHLRANSNVLFVVDYTPGFSGDEVAAANSVRKLYANVPGYRELSFAPITLGSATGRRWEYVDRGQHSVDIFFNACNASFAVRGATPADGWSLDYNFAFYNAAASLKPSC